MNLVLFEYSISKICIISRIQSLHSGHGVLVGPIGTGKKSMLALSN